MPELQTFARNLKVAREAAGLSQQQLADQAGLDRTYVSSLERGIGNPSLSKMASLSTVLNTSVVGLLTLGVAASEDPSPSIHSSDDKKVLDEVVATLRRRGVID